MRKLLYIALALSAVVATIIFGSFAVQSAAMPNKINWSTVAPSPFVRHEAASALVGGKLYVFGGYTNDGTFIPRGRSDVYDPVTNTWTQIANMPDPAVTHAGTVVDGRNVYFAGGYAGPGGGINQTFATTAAWKYNVDTNAWTAIPSLPEARGAGAMAALDGKLHFFGGADINRKDKGDHWVLSLNGGTSWTKAAPLPNPRNHLGRAELSGKIYAIGGQKGTNDKINQQSEVDVWNPATPNTWKRVASLPKGRSHIAGSTFVMGGRIFVIGGLTNTSLPQGISDVTAYDPQSNSWRALTPLPEPASSGVARSIKNQIFYTSGFSLVRKTYKGVLVTGS